MKNKCSVLCLLISAKCVNLNLAQIFVATICNHYIGTRASPEKSQKYCNHCKVHVVVIAELMSTECKNSNMTWHGEV